MDSEDDQGMNHEEDVSSRVIVDDFTTRALECLGSHNGKYSTSKVRAKRQRLVQEMGEAGLCPEAVKEINQRISDYIDSSPDLKTRTNLTRFVQDFAEQLRDVGLYHPPSTCANNFKLPSHCNHTIHPQQSIHHPNANIVSLIAAQNARHAEERKQDEVQNNLNKELLAELRDNGLRQHQEAQQREKENYQVIKDSQTLLSREQEYRNRDIDRMSDENKDLKGEIKDLKGEISALRTENAALLRQVGLLEINNYRLRMKAGEIDADEHHLPGFPRADESRHQGFHPDENHPGAFVHVGESRPRGFRQVNESLPTELCSPHTRSKRPRTMAS